MLFDKNDDVQNERILYHTKPNMLFGCKKAILGFVILAVVLIVAPRVIKFIGDMQVYLISHVNLALTRYAAVAFFIVILFIIIFIIWQLIGWYSKEYILTQSRVIIKSGVLSTKKNYMPYRTIQDINTSQSVLGKAFNVGSIYLFSAYDNNQMELSAISNPSEIEEVIFSNMVNYRTYNEPGNQRYEGRGYGNLQGQYYDDMGYNNPRGEYYGDRGYNNPKGDYYDDRSHNNPQGQYYDDRDYIEPIGQYHDDSRSQLYDDGSYERGFQTNENYLERNEYYDEFEPITPIGREKDNPQRRNYDYYPDELSFEENNHKKYEYEPYNDKFYNAKDRVLNSNSVGYDEPPRQYQNDARYNEATDNYSYGGESNYTNNGLENYYNEDVENNVQNQPKEVDVSSEKVIRRHFDKFKKN